MIGHNDPFADEPLEPRRTLPGPERLAIAARTLATFEEGLGRRVPWAFRGHELFLVPAPFRS